MRLFRGSYIDVGLPYDVFEIDTRLLHAKALPEVTLFITILSRQYPFCNQISGRQPL